MGTKVIYTRVSKDPDGVSISPEAQHAECVREAERRGWDLATITHLSDVDLSAWSRSVERPSWRADPERVEVTVRGTSPDATQPPPSD